MPGALSTEATLPPLNLLRHSQMGALLSGEKRAGRTFGRLSPPKDVPGSASTAPPNSPVSGAAPRAPSHPQDLHRSHPVGSSVTLLCQAPGRGAGMRFGSGVQALLTEATVLLPACSSEHAPAPELLSRTWPGSLSQELGVPWRTNRARWRRLQDSCATCELQPAALPMVTGQPSLPCPDSWGCKDFP